MSTDRSRDQESGDTPSSDDVAEVAAALLNATISSVAESIDQANVRPESDSVPSDIHPDVAPLPAAVSSTSSPAVGLGLGNGGSFASSSSSTNLIPPVTSGSGAESVTSSSSSAALAGSQPVAKADLPFNQQTFCPRPPKTIEVSALGQKIVVEANFYQIAMRDNITVYSYDLQYVNSQNKPIIKRDETKRLFWVMVSQNPAVFPPITEMVFNDVNILWTLRPLSTRKRGDFTLPVRFGMGRFTKEFAVRICFTGMLTIEQKPRDKKERAALQCFLDALLTMRIRSPPCPDSRYFVSHGSSMFFAPSDRAGLDSRLVAELGLGLEAWTGLHGAVKPDLQNGLLYNVDIGHSVFHKQNYDLVRFYCEVLKRMPFPKDHDQMGLRGCNDVLSRMGLDMKGRALLESALKGTSITARYGTYEKTCKFSAVGNKAARCHEFQMESGQRMTVAEYFQNVHHIRLRFPGLPCIKIGKRNSWVPMECVFTSTEPSKFRGKIPEAQLGRMVRGTAFPPLERRKIIAEMASANQQNEATPVYLSAQDDNMRTFGVSIDQTFQKVMATVLPVPTLTFGNNEKYTDKDHHGVWKLTNSAGNGMKQVVVPHSKKLVSAVIFVTGTDSAQTDQEYRDLAPFGTLMRVLHEFGVIIPGGEMPFLVSKFSQRTDGFKRLEEWMRELKEKVHKYDKDAIPMCLFVLPYKCTTVRQRRHETYYSEYSMIKYICDVVVGIHSQCILQNTYKDMRGNPLSCSTAHNMALKILGKVGAVQCKLEREGMHQNWTKLTNPDEPTLLLGVDVTHPGEEDRKSLDDYTKLSVACVVGNIDLDCVQFRPSVRAQKQGEERLVSMKDEVQDRIRQFEEANSVKPAHIVVFRDGVSETEFQTTLFEEKKSLEMACLDLHADYKPTISYVVVSKRHHTRFFPTRIEDCEGEARNLKPGTLVETGVTTSSYFDFYLLSQFGPLGTSRPTHYYVLWDDWNPSHTFWPTIVHALSYTYVRCPKSISQPSPVMYAHLAAKKAKEHIQGYHGSNGAEISSMTPYEYYVRLNESIQQNKELNGMVFV